MIIKMIMMKRIMIKILGYIYYIFIIFLSIENKLKNLYIGFKF